MRVHMRQLLLSSFLLLLVVSGCTQNQAAPNYDEIKKVMTDAIQTEDGKKVLRQVFSDPEFKELLVLEQGEVKKAVTETMLSKKGEEFWKKQFEDPKFQETIAKSMQKQQEEVMKKLMNDSTFQKEMEELIKMTDEIERTQASRIKSLAKLSKDSPQNNIPNYIF